jgi:UDP-glucose 4-epimerase
MFRDVALVTGGAGFIGSHVAKSVLDMGLECVVLDDLSGGFAENVPKEATFIEGDICDQQLIEHLFSKYKFKYVYHLAAYAAENLSHFIKRFNYNNNVIGSINLINSAVNFDCQCFVFTSSIAAYGHCPPPMTEDMVPNPADSYGIAKYAVEKELEVTYKMFGLPYVIFRPHNVYGIGQNIGDPYRNVIGIFMNRLMDNRPMPIFGDGLQTRAFSYISDVAPYIASSPMMEAARGKIFNVGADEPTTVKELAELVAEAMGKPCSIDYLEERNEVKHAFAEHSLFKQFFRPGESTTLQTGIQLMAEWAKSVGVRHSKEFELIEIEKNLPAAWRRKLHS